MKTKLAPWILEENDEDGVYVLEGEGTIVCEQVLPEYAKTIRAAREMKAVLRALVRGRNRLGYRLNDSVKLADQVRTVLQHAR